jgi:hypothetical protein
MALQTSGAITLSDIQTEFGGSNPISLSEYYAGGLYVPSGTSGTNGAVPTSGEIAVSDFYGASSGLTVTVTEATKVVGGAAYHGFALANSITTEIGYITHSAFGSRSPTSWNGITIVAAYYVPTDPDKHPQDRFYFILSGNRAQSVFTELDIQGHGVVASASADAHGYVSNRNYTFWRWHITPSDWDGSGTRTVTIIE